MKLNRIAVGVLLSALTLTGCSQTPVDDRDISVISVVGDVLVNDEEVVLETLLETTETTVVTDEESEARLLIDEDKQLYVEENTSLTIQTTGTAEASTTQVILTEGSVTSEILETLTEDSTYQVVVGNSVFDVQGTIYRVDSASDDEGNQITTLHVFEGEVLAAVTNEDEETEELSVEGGSTIAIDETNATFVEDDEGNVISDIDYSTLPVQSLEILQDIQETNERFDDIDADTLASTIDEILNPTPEEEEEEVEEEEETVLDSSTSASTGSSSNSSSSSSSNSSSSGATSGSVTAPSTTTVTSGSTGLVAGVDYDLPIEGSPFQPYDEEAASYGNYTREEWYATFGCMEYVSTGGFPDDGFFGTYGKYFATNDEATAWQLETILNPDHEWYGYKAMYIGNPDGTCRIQEYDTYMSLH